MTLLGDLPTVLIGEKLLLNHVQARAAAAATLGEMGPATAKDAIEPLQRLLKTDSNETVRKAAQDALQKIERKK